MTSSTRDREPGSSQSVIRILIVDDDSVLAAARALGIACVLPKDQIDQLGGEIYRLAG